VSARARLRALSFFCLAAAACRQGKEGHPIVRTQQPDGDAAQRARMVDTQIVARGVRDPRVLAAMRKVPRHLFVDAADRASAYEDHPLPIAGKQTISQPYIVALMSELLTLAPDSRVLEIGTGSGYQTALLAALAGPVFTIERVPALAKSAQAALRSAGLIVSMLVGDGTLGWSAYAPYDAILVAAGGPEIPPPLVEQLSPRGRMIIPLGARGAQKLTVVRRTAGGVQMTPIGDARFVPLVGEHGLVAVRDAVLPQVSGLHAGRRDLELSAAGCALHAVDRHEARAAGVDQRAPVHLPHSRRVSLP